MVAKCGQCGREAVVSVDRANLCVSCYATFEASLHLAFQRNAAMLNLAMAEMDAAVGLAGFTPRLQIPEGPRVNNQHTVNVIGSTVGVINTGSVREIAVSLQHLQAGGQAAAHDALKAVTEAVLGSDVAPEIKNEILESLAFLGGQASAPSAERKPSVVKNTLRAVRELASTAGAVAAAWETAEPVLRGLFGI